MSENDDPLVRRVRCSGCAFTPGTEANLDPATQIKTAACVNTGTYFYCHRDVTDTRDLKDGEALCAGWLQAVTEKIESGALEATPPEERVAMVDALLIIEEVEEGKRGLRLELH